MVTPNENTSSIGPTARQLSLFPPRGTRNHAFIAANEAAVKLARRTIADEIALIGRASNSFKLFVNQKRAVDIALGAPTQSALRDVIGIQASTLQKTMASIALRPSPFEKAAEAMALQAAAFQKEVIRSQSASW